MMIQSVAILIGPGIFVIEHDIRHACYVSSHAERVFGRQIWYGRASSVIYSVCVAFDRGKLTAVAAAAARARPS